MVKNKALNGAMQGTEPLKWIHVTFGTPLHPVQAMQINWKKITWYGSQFGGTSYIRMYLIMVKARDY
jgi:hypothetical protein